VSPVSARCVYTALRCRQAERDAARRRSPPAYAESSLRGKPERRAGLLAGIAHRHRMRHSAAAISTVVSIWMNEPVRRWSARAQPLCPRKAERTF
jgi:hypothetical protein